jgi:hypothetical protein
MKPVPLRIAIKDKQNECTLFSPRVTVVREMVNTPNGSGSSNGNGSNGRPVPSLNTPPPRSAADARDAFDRLFKKQSD